MTIRLAEVVTFVGLMAVLYGVWVFSCALDDACAAANGML